MIQNIIPLIPLLPLIGFVLCYVFRKQLSAITAGSIASALVLLPFIASIVLFFSQHDKLEISVFNWISAGTINVPFSFYIDHLAITMMMIVTGVGFLIHVYSIGYMSHDENVSIFFSYMNLFIFFMLMLVMGANYVMLFIGWEGVGLCSYLLIGFWYKNNNYNLAARKAFVMNRIGDLGFLLGIISLFYLFGTTSFTEVFSKATGLQSGNSALTLITILLLIGAIGKSAQIPLFTWLPDAMAGPTPVSSLIHAATMVTAGVYLIARSSVLYMLTPFTLDLIIFIGLATALFAATIGILQNDIKKVLAYSTVSQLGYMFLALGLGSFSIAMFHVTTHAFFKALLFLGAGSVIHAMGGEQDIRQMGGLKKALPVTYATFLIGTLTITGIPPLSGFFSKDAILSGAFEHNIWLWIGGLAGALFTCFYMFRLVFLVFRGTFRGSEEQKQHLHESPAVMTVPLIILAVLALLGGFMNIPSIFGGHENFSEYLKPSLQGQNFVPSAIPHNVEFLNIGISVILLLCIILIAWKMYIRNKIVPESDEISRKGIARVVYAKYYVDELYNYVFVKSYESISENILPWFERNIVDGFVNGSGWLTIRCGNIIRRVQNGSINLYLFFMAGGMLAMLIYFLLR
jgi:NADH-quinone oxidoreductase subunit L